MNIHLSWALLGKCACAGACIGLTIVVAFYATAFVSLTGWDVFWENLKPDWYVRRVGRRREQEGLEKLAKERGDR